MIRKNQNSFYSSLNLSDDFNTEDLIVDVNEQVKYLIERGLKTSNIKELKHIIENYGFNKLFRKYSRPFLEFRNNEPYFKENISEKNIISLYYFDYELTNLLIKYLGLLEAKLTGNLVNNVNLACPDATKQLDYLWPSAKQQQYLIKNVINSCNNGSRYLQPFIDAKIYPAWIIFNEMTLGEKMQSFSRLRNIESILQNFYLPVLPKKEFITIFFDFIRPFRNVSAHFDRLFKFVVNLKGEQNVLFQKLVKIAIRDEKLCQEIIEKNSNTLNSFALIFLLTSLLGFTIAKIFVNAIKKFIQENQVENQPYFDVQTFLTSPSMYNWPTNWSQILDQVISVRESLHTEDNKI